MRIRMRLAIVLVVFVVAGAAALMNSKNASAGAKVTQTVSIDLVAQTATGVLSDARSSQDSIQYIKCSIYGQRMSNTLNISCAAMDESKNFLYCSSYVNLDYNTGLHMLDAVKSLKGDSELSFQKGEYGHCVYIAVHNSSSRSPKEP